MSKLLRPTLLALVLLVPLAHASMVVREPADPALAAPVGEYLDAFTGVSYAYEPSTDSLVPMGYAVGRDGFFGIDAYPAGTKSGLAGGVGDCRGPEFCIAVKALPANPDRRLRAIWVEYQTLCDEEPVPLGTTLFSAPAYRYDPAWALPDCPDSYVRVALKLDGVTMASDQLDY